MGKPARKSVNIQENLEVAGSALPRTEAALRAADLAEELTGKSRSKSRKLLKLAVALTIIGIAASVISKARARRSTPPGNPDPYGTSSTEV